MDYVGKHAESLEKLKADGKPANFTREVPGTYDPLTDTATPPTTVVISGYAAEIPGDPDQYEAMELIGTSAITLIWVPVTYGDVPGISAQLVWRGALRTIQQIFPISPVELVIAARIILT